LNIFCEAIIEKFNNLRTALADRNISIKQQVGCSSTTRICSQRCNKIIKITKKRELIMKLLSYMHVK